MRRKDTVKMKISVRAVDIHNLLAEYQRNKPTGFLDSKKDSPFIAALRAFSLNLPQNLPESFLDEQQMYELS